MLSVKEWLKDRFRYSEERLDICRKCEHFNADSSQCNRCGCFMDYKTLLPFATCPIGKWGSDLLDGPEGNNKLEEQ